MIDAKTQKTWLQMAYLGLQHKIQEDKELHKQIIYFLANQQKGEEVTFECLHDKIKKLMPDNPNPVNDKNTFGNYVLLDSRTNRGYGNAIYPAKRMTIIGKDQGLQYVFKENSLEYEPNSRKKSFIPPCTRNVFMKYYTPNSTDIMNWTQEDAEAYTMQIYECLKEFGVEAPRNLTNNHKEG